MKPQSQTLVPLDLPLSAHIREGTRFGWSADLRMRGLGVPFHRGMGTSFDIGDYGFDKPSDTP
jgi:hypothetical protein